MAGENVVMISCAGRWAQKGRTSGVDGRDVTVDPL